MKIYGLTSTEPIIKRYERNPDGTLEKTSYPRLYEFSSQEHEVTNISEFETVIRAVASSGGCLLKGLLSSNLQAESRAGSTNPDTHTEWICLDLDGVEGIQSVDQLLQELGLGDVDYVLQWSSSMGIENSSGFRCHVFMMLDKPASPHLLKQWLQHLNLTSPTLKANLGLTKTYNSIRWPLDVTTCQNDKLLYVSPPYIAAGVVDPFLNLPRISSYIKAKRVATLPENIPPPPMIREKTDEAINVIRKSSGYSERKASKYLYSGETEYVSKPDQAVITGQRVERGFVYFNLNGGDSWGYYHPDDNPSFIYNFKGEPVYKTSELLPAYWTALSQKVKNHIPNSAGNIYLVFRDLHTSKYWNGTYNTHTNVLDIHEAKSKDNLHDFMKQRGQPIPDFIPDWTMEYNPHDPQIVDTIGRRINTFRTSQILAAPAGIQSGPPPTIEKLVKNFLGDDPATLEHFYNWLAVIVQNLDRTGTCWLLQGIQGTGKGYFVDKVMRPILGETNVVGTRVDQVESQFTNIFRDKLLIFVDEMEKSKKEDWNWAKITAKLKNFIVEPKISIRPMYQEAVEVVNYSNILFSSNKTQGVQIDMDDRRYNVGDYQRIKLETILTDHELDVTIPSEVVAFADYLRTRTADVSKARKPIDNAPRRKLQTIGQTAIDEIAMKLREGDLEYFEQWKQNPDTVQQKKYAAVAYNDLIDELISSQRPYLTREDLQIILGWLLDNIPHTPVKFSSFIKHHDIELLPQWINNKTVRVLKVQWIKKP